MKIVIYGLTVTSSWGNGHATTYRSLLKALARRGHHIHFIEKDVEWYRNHRDLSDPEFCTVQLYESWEQSETRLIAASNDADVVVLGSYFPDAVRAAECLIKRSQCPVVFYDIDTPITMAALRERGRADYLNALMIPRLSAYLSFTGGPTLLELRDRFGAQRAVALYCSVDAELYQSQPSREEFQCEISYLGTYARDRQPKLMRLLNETASMLPDRRFLVAGPQYPNDINWQPNVRRIDHVSPPDHPAFYSSARFTLNLTRDDMVAAGYSPSVRLFEASALGATIISDAWPGLEDFLTPGQEILLAEDTVTVVRLLREMSEFDRKALGQRARKRILSAHTSEHRAREFEQIVADCRAA